VRRRIQSRDHLHGAAVVIDVDTGEVLAAVSYPWPTADDVAGKTLDSDQGSTDRLLDRSRYGLYPPGSIFKLVVAGAALRSNVAAEFTCTRLPDGRVGSYIRGSRRPVRDDLLDTVPHGHVDLHKGLVVSCNAYFAQLAQRLGARPLLDASAVFQIDAARLPTPAGVGGTLPHAGYGQGEVLVSPLKMARVAAAIAAGGVVRPVRWEAAPDDEVAPVQRFLSAPDAAVLSRHMRDVVLSGTGRSLAANPTPIAGKTGTAEVANGRSHSWFVGFAPFGGPRRIAFAVIIENAGYGGQTAAPLAGELVSAARQAGLFR
jgi:peptidoglycan glycosyltransferase